MMYPLVYVYYYGEVSIGYWEWVLSVFYVFILYLVFARKKNRMITKYPEYKYYVWGLLAKLFGGVVFSLIYFYYYNGGDTIAYFYSALAMSNLFGLDPLLYFDHLFGEGNLERWSHYTSETGKPYQFLFFDHRTYFVIRLMSILAIATFKSYLVTTLLVASVSYLGVWQCYRTFVSYFPQIKGKLAISFLFVPSLLFWGSGILKDTITFSAVCWWIHSIDEMFFKRRNKVSNGVVLVICAILMIIIKPYIFMVLFPVTLLWLFYFRVVALRNILVKFVLLPIMALILMTLSFFVLSRLGEKLDKFALDEALQTIHVTQADLVRSESYGTNSFNIGELDGTWWGVISKFPIATNAALFRPYIWESTNVVVALNGLENLWFLILAIVALLRAGPFFTIKAITGNPLLLMCMTFAVLFAFTVGVTTPNFGALVRFKIPMVPFFISALYIIVFLARIKRARLRNGLPFDVREFRHGSAHLGGNERDLRLKPSKRPVLQPAIA